MTDKPLDCVGIDPAKSQVGKHDFVLTERSPESKDAYYLARITELVTARSELDAVIRERDALKDTLTFYAETENHRGKWIALACGCCSEDVPPAVETDEGERARETLARLASGDLRKR